ncbi:hypothetical protein EUX98_g5415 [Antrodiella citrinella]|uniref:Peptidase S9 prolyl oligopeptidase catalytic domain-containing protein n=1 Tax=Antrodiella citrinella TaxID=2447956 RepID=A0A4S4MTY2_9APHY|nr:hypothetical protein EUX98_g5415 [Antrodiella citrinella]
MLANASLVHNPNAWSEKYNLLALDHVQASRMVSLRTAAVDVYDFLQKIYVLFPHLAKNKLVLASGSYGGIYVPHIATEIHQGNLALAAGGGEPGAKHINLAMTVSNPLSDTLSHFRWLTTRCQNPIANVYNDGTEVAPATP